MACAGDLVGAEPAHQEGGDREEADLGEQHQADGEADADDLAQARPVGRPHAGEDVVAAEAAVALDVEQHQAEHHDVDDGGGDAGARELEPRKAPVAEDQRVVAERVDDDAGDA